MNFFGYKKKKPPKKKELESIAVGEFAHQHKDLIIIVADPADDTIFVSYNDKFASGKIKTTEGKHAFVLKGLMETSDLFETNIDRFVASLVDVMKIKRMSVGMNNFLQYIDGALYNISNKHRKSAKGGPQDGAVKSPVSMADLKGRIDGEKK